MSERLRKIASLIQHVAAAELATLPESAYLTVTHVQVSPDLRAGTVWIGVLASTEPEAVARFAAAAAHRDRLQAAVARRLTTKFVPRLTVERDAGGQYAERINRLIRGL